MSKYDIDPIEVLSCLLDSSKIGIRVSTREYQSIIYGN